MSFEGFYQRLCKNGHYTTQDAMTAMYCGDEEKCPRCGEKFVWENIVDETNGSHEGDERIDGYVCLEEKSRKICEHCNSVLDVTYKLPKSKRRKK